MATSPPCPVTLHSGDSDFGCRPLHCGGSANITILPDYLRFVLRLDGTRTDPQKVTVSNTGTAAVKLNSIRLVAGAKDFKLLNEGGYPSSLAPSEGFDIVVDFLPDLDGQYVGVLEITTNEDKLPYTVALYSQVTKLPGFAEDIAKLDERIKALLTALNQEINARIREDAADRAYAQGLNALEVTTRANADRYLQEQITALKTGVSQLTNEVNNRIDNVINNNELTQIVNQNTFNRIDGDVKNIDQKFANEITNSYATINEFRTAYATDQEAFAQRIITIQAEFASEVNGAKTYANALVSEEQRARANAFEAEAVRVTTVLAEYSTKGETESTAKALIKVTETAFANALKAEASRIDMISADYTTRGDVNVTTSAMAQTITTAYTDAIKAEATKTETLLASYETTDGAMARASALSETITKSYADAIKAEASRTDTLLVGYTSKGDLEVTTNALNQSISKAYSDAVGASASRMDTLLANYETTNGVDLKVAAGVSSSNLATANAIKAEAERVDKLFAEFDPGTGDLDGKIEAVVTDKIKTYADAQGAQGERISTVEATAKGLTTSVQDIKTATVDVSGNVFSKAVLNLNANGHVVGTTSTNDGRVGKLVLLYDSYSFMTPSGNNIFYYSDPSVGGDGKVHMPDVVVNTIEAGAVKGENLASGAVLRTYWRTMSEDVRIAPNAQAVVASVSFTKDSDSSTMKCQFFGMFESPDDIQYDAWFRVDGGTLYYLGNTNIVLDSSRSNGRMTTTSFQYIEGLPKGGHTIEFICTWREVDNFEGTIKAGSTLEVIEIKRGALG